ncbi:MAG: glycosyltransferase [Candidatus Hodarchaeota archaeon]
MQIDQVLKLFLFSSVLIPITIIIFYGTMLTYYYKLKHKKYELSYKIKYNKLPDINILIPTHNEETIISKRIENISNTNYPIEKIKTIFIDDSSDSTPDIINKYAEKNNNVYLIHFNNRIGYSSAIQAGIQASNTDVIVLNEAGSFPRPDALLRLISHFENPEIGGVSGKSEILNREEKIGKMECLYLKIINFIRESESYMDSTFYIKGEATAYRKDLVSDIKVIPNTGAIDNSMAFLVRKKGYKCIYDPNVVFDEYAPSDDVGYIKQKTTRAANWMRYLLVHRDMIFSRKYGKFGCLTLPFNFLMLFIFPFFPLIFISSILIGLFTSPVFFIRISILLIIITFLIALLAKNFLVLLIEIEISLLKAIYEIFLIRKEHDKIERVESTRKIV